MDNTNDPKLNFPQRHWFLLLVLVAILSPMVVYWITAAAHKQTYDQAMHPRPTATDTSYKVASPPGGADSAKGGGGVQPGGGTTPAAGAANPGAASPGTTGSKDSAAAKKP